MLQYIDARRAGSVVVVVVLHTPNMALRSGSLKRKGMLETWRRLGISLGEEEPPATLPAPLVCTTTPEPTPTDDEDPDDRSMVVIIPDVGVVLLDETEQPVLVAAATA